MGSRTPPGVLLVPAPKADAIHGYVQVAEQLMGATRDRMAGRAASLPEEQQRPAFCSPFMTRRLQQEGPGHLKAQQADSHLLDVAMSARLGAFKPAVRAPIEEVEP